MRAKKSIGTAHIYNDHLKRMNGVNHYDFLDNVLDSFKVQATNLKELATGIVTGHPVDAATKVAINNAAYQKERELGRPLTDSERKAVTVEKVEAAAKQEITGAFSGVFNALTGPVKTVLIVVAVILIVNMIRR